jgi:hypothetical protein
VAETIKILGQSAPAATTYTTLYTVPAATTAVLSSISVCNTNGGAQTVRLHIVPAAGSESTANAIVYDVSITANNTLVLTMGITMGAGDFIRIYASTTNISFQAFGSELG